MQTLYRSVSDVPSEAPATVSWPVPVDGKSEDPGAWTLTRLLDVVVASLRSARAGLGD